MGYTHYWKFLGNNLNVAKRKSIAEDLYNIYYNIIRHTDSFIYLNGCRVYIYPVFNEYEIFFNGGDREPDELMDKKEWEERLYKNECPENSHETFRINFEKDLSSGDFRFCKTARKPYDLMVCISLLRVKNDMGEFMELSSDGDLDEGCWPYAHEILDRYMGIK